MVVTQNLQSRRWSAAINMHFSRLGDGLQRIPLGAVQKLATALLLVYCCHVLARLFWLLMPTPELAAPTPEQLVQMPSTSASAPALAIDIEALKRMHLFGKPGADTIATVQQVVPVIEAEQTRLDLLLLGVVVSDVASSARAVIAHRNQQELFAIGDELPGGSQVKLHQVLPGRVIIDNAGRYEALWLYEEKKPAQKAEALVAAVAPQEPAIAPVPAPRPQPITPGLTNKPITAPESLADIIQFTPVHADGRVLGYRIAPGRAPQLFDRFGLKRNDVITSVNGIALDDPSKALKIYRQIQGATSANFELVRDGEAKLIEIELDGDRGQG